MLKDLRCLCDNCFPVVHGYNPEMGDEDFAFGVPGETCNRCDNETGAVVWTPWTLVD